MVSKSEKLWLGIIIVVAGLFLSLWMFNVSKAATITNSELSTVWSEAKSKNNDVSQRSTSNKLGTKDYIMVGQSRLHSSRTVHMSFGFEISMTNLDDELDYSYVDPFDSDYNAYNGSVYGQSASGSYKEATDPHYYTSNKGRVSFIVNNYFASTEASGNELGSGNNVSAGTIVQNNITYSIWCIGENVIHEGIKMTNSAWNTNYEKWLNDTENKVRLSFGWDNVRTATYNGDYVDMYTSSIYNDRYKGLASKIAQLARDAGHIEWAESVWITKSPHTVNMLGSPTQVYADGAYPASQVARCNGRYNYRRTASGWGYGLSDGSSPRYKEVGDQWTAYNRNKYLQKDNYGGRVYTWKNYQNDNVFGTATASYFKRYFCSEVVKPIPEPEDVEEESIAANKIILTKNEGSTSNISTGLDESDVTISGNLYTAPEIYTYNVDDVTEDGSQTFDIGDAIPTTESYRNYIEEDKWYGHTEIEKVDYAQKLTGRVQSEVIYTYTITWPITDEDGEPTGAYGSAFCSATYTQMYYPTFNWYSSNYDMAFYRISDADLYELQTSYTLNNSSGTANYDLSNSPKLQYTVRINGNLTTETAPQVVTPTAAYTTASQWIANTTYLQYSSLGQSAIGHLYVPSEAGTSRTINLGTNPSYVPSGMDSDAASRAQNFYNNLCNQAGIFTKHNDIFTVAGYTYLTDDASDYHKGIAEQCKPYFGSKYEMNETLQAYEKAYANSVRTIPVKTRNGEYYTDLEALYKRFVTKDNTKELYVSDIMYATKSAIKEEEQWLHNEPVVVFSPVMSPISIESNDTTQLVNGVGETVGVTQMRLDGKYTLNFDWDAYFQQQGYGNPAGYTRYIDEKYLSFPFSVYINDHYYEPDNTASGFGSGYTEWVAVGPQTTSVEIYIPTWALEGLYGADIFGLNQSDFFLANYNPIEVRVEANNVPEELVMAGEVEYNTNARSDANYVATYELGVQISGWIYEFEVNSVYDYKNFAPSTWEDKYDVGIYSFTEQTDDTNYEEAEKRVGSYNRLGTQIGNTTFDYIQRQNVRFTQDGYMTDDWSGVNTLAMARGKTSNSKNAGYLVRGNTIAFSLKTIANLSGENDSISITPSYRYYDASANETPNIDVYYIDHGELIKMGSTKDLQNTTSISLGQFPNYIFYEDAYYDYFYDTLATSAFYDLHDASNTQEKLYKESVCYSVGNITIDSTLRLITGNEEELVDNITWLNNAQGAIYEGGSMVMAAPIRYALDGSQGTNKYNLTKSQYGYVSGDVYDNSYKNYSFVNSMQTWYGQYKIPSDILVCPKGAVEEYIAGGHDHIDGTEDFWLSDDGYLVLNFDIETLKDGNEHLQYYSSTSAGMWGNEKGKGTPDPDPTEDPDTHIPEKPGDIGIIPLKYNSVKQHYDIGVLYLN